MSLPPWFAVLGLVALAPVLPGIALKTRARLTRRTGGPVLQQYYDVAKLLRRGRVIDASSTQVFRLAPALGFAAALAAACFLPQAGAGAAIRFSGDMIAFVGLLALGRFVLALGCLDTGSSFEGMGVARELAVSLFSEPALFLCLAILALATRELSLSAMLGAPLAAAWDAAPGALVMATLVLFVVLIGESGRGPVDDPTTHLELTMIHEVMVLEYGGPDLALVLLAASLRLAIQAGLIAGVLLPRLDLARGAVPVAFVLIVLAVPVVIGMLETLLARLRMNRVPLFLISASIVGLLGCLLLVR